MSKDVDVTSLGIAAGGVATLDPAHLRPAYGTICDHLDDYADALTVASMCGVLAGGGLLAVTS